MTSASTEFHPLPLADGLLAETPSARIFGVTGGDLRVDEGTSFGIVCDGDVSIDAVAGSFLLGPGMFFVAPGALRWHGGTGLAIVVPAYRGVFQVGGPLEARGRLRYIDGCTDTLLVCPPRRGDPSLNHLHIPPGTRQAAHTHASDRVGVIARGRGTCVTPAGRTPLSPGMGWWIPAGLRHCFHTEEEALDVVAWHPDSVFGPTDEAHPMILGTIR